MSWITHYAPPSRSSWQGRADTAKHAAFFRIIQLLDLTKPISNNRPAFACLGFCCDEGIKRNAGRPGAAGGPNAIRAALAKLPVQKENIICYDAGDITCTNGDLEAAQLALAEAVALLLQHHITPIILGGGHELAWGHYQGIAKHIAAANLGIVNFDAHFDMRPLLENNKGSSGTPFLQIAQTRKNAGLNVDYNCIGIQYASNMKSLFDTAQQFDVHSILADDLYLGKTSMATDLIKRILNANEWVYLSLCLDVFSAADAPGVSAPQPLGLTPWQLLPFIRHLAASRKVISYDIAELCPPFDINQHTAKLAASFVYEIIHNHETTS